MDYTWRGSLDAFNDILRGGFGTPEDGFILRWINSDISREKLGKEATIEWYKERTLNAHPSNRSYMSVKLEEMKQGIGETIFDWIIKIIKIHGEDGEESEDGVELILE